MRLNLLEEGNGIVKCKRGQGITSSLPNDKAMNAVECMLELQGITISLPNDRAMNVGTTIYTLSCKYAAIYP